MGKMGGFPEGGNQGGRGASSTQFTDWVIGMTLLQVIEIRALFALESGQGLTGKGAQGNFSGW